MWKSSKYMGKKKNNQPAPAVIYMAPGAILNNVNQSVTATQYNGCRLYEYDHYVIMFQSILGAVALIKAVKTIHWRIIAMMIAKMESSGRTIIFPSILARELGFSQKRSVDDALKELIAWNVIYRPVEEEQNIYKFNQRFLYKGTCRDTFYPNAEPKLFPHIGREILPPSQLRKLQKIESNNDFDHQVDEVNLINQDYLSTEINNQ